MINKQDVYEEFYQYRKVPSTEPQWIELRELIDKLMADVERDTIDRVLEIIDSKKYSRRWNIQEELWNDKMDEIKTEVMMLKGGEQR